MTRCALLVSLMIGCGAGAAAPEPQRATPVILVQPAPAGEPTTTTPERAAPSCDVRRVTESEMLPDGRVRLRASLVALGEAPIEVTLPDRCPMGPVAFSGLAPGYDYDGACAMGACPGPRTARQVRLAPGQPVAIAEVVIDPRGTGCTAPLSPGRYHVAFAVDLGAPGLATCEDGADLEIAASSPSPTPTPRPATPPAPRPPPRPSPETRTCPQQPACGLACPGGSFARDENGCTLCACEERGIPVF